MLLLKSLRTPTVSVRKTAIGKICLVSSCKARQLRLTTGGQEDANQTSFSMEDRMATLTDNSPAGQRYAGAYAEEALCQRHRAFQPQVIAVPRPQGQLGDC